MLRKKGSPMSSRIQPRQKDKGKGNACDAQQKKSTEEGKRYDYQMKYKKHRKGGYSGIKKILQITANYAN